MTSSLRLSSGFALLVMVAGCSHSSGPLASRAGGAVGYVQMEDLVKKHPLYPQLAHVDDAVAALQLRNSISGPDLSPAEIARAQNTLTAELDAAQKRTLDALKAKQVDYGKREKAAATALLEQAHVVAPAGAGALRSIDRTSAQQSAAAVQAAQSGLRAYHDQALKTGQSALNAAHSTLVARAGDQYRAKADELQQAESNLALAQSSAHAAERLSLRTRLSNLALDDAARDQARARLAELDRQETDALAAMRNRDQATLATYQTQLDKTTQREFAQRTQAIRERMTSVDAHAAQANRDLVGQIGAGSGTTVVAADFPPDVRAQLRAMHERYQSDFNKDAQATVDGFKRTQRELEKRIERLHGVDMDAEASTQRQLLALKKQRSDLYAQIVAEIEGEVRLIAQRRGVAVVVGQVVAPADGVDLTSDAAKAVETLHE